MEWKELGNSEPKLVWVRVMSVQRERVMGREVETWVEAVLLSPYKPGKGL